MDTGEVDVVHDVAVDPSVATGTLLRRYAESSLGELSPADASTLATAVAAHPEALGYVLGLNEDQSRDMDPVEVQSRIMGTYYSMRFAQDLAATLDSQDEDDEAESRRVLETYAHAASMDESQLQEAEALAAGGDCSALNRAEEMFFFS